MAKSIKDAYKHSIMTDDLETCYLCGREAVQYHHVFGAYNREHSTEDGLFVPLCLDCHIKVHNERSQKTNYALKRRGQEAYQEIYGPEAFLKRYGKSYL